MFKGLTSKNESNGTWKDTLLIALEIFPSLRNTLSIKTSNNDNSEKEKDQNEDIQQANNLNNAINKDP